MCSIECVVSWRCSKEELAEGELLYKYNTKPWEPSCSLKASLAWRNTWKKLITWSGRLGRHTSETLKWLYEVSWHTSWRQWYPLPFLPTCLYHSPLQESSSTRPSFTDSLSRREGAVIAGSCTVFTWELQLISPSRTGTCTHQQCCPTLALVAMLVFYFVPAALHHCLWNNYSTWVWSFQWKCKPPTCVNTGVQPGSTQNCQAPAKKEGDLVAWSWDMRGKQWSPGSWGFL